MCKNNRRQVLSCPFCLWNCFLSTTHGICTRVREYIHNQMNSECLPKYSSCIKANNLCGDSVKISPYVCISSWHPSIWKKHCKASSSNTLLKMYLSLLDLLWQQNLGWGTAHRHCTIHSAAIHLTKESRRTLWVMLTDISTYKWMLLLVGNINFVSQFHIYHLLSCKKHGLLWQAYNVIYLDF